MEKNFDSLKWLREVRERHYEERKHMTWEEQEECIRAGARQYQEWAVQHKLELFRQGLDGRLPDGTRIPLDPGKPADLTLWPFYDAEAQETLVSPADVAAARAEGAAALARQQARTTG